MRNAAFAPPAPPGARAGSGSALPARPSPARPALAGIAALLALALAAPVHAHGDTSGAKRFHEHLDDYGEEVAALSEEVDALVAKAAAGRDLSDGDLDGLVDRWEAVGVHAAIERKASPLYPGVWQALIRFREAAEGGAAEAELRERARALRAALWQGLGAVKLAASQVEEVEAADAAAAEEPAAGPAGDGARGDPRAAVAAIQGALDRAAEAYAEGEVERAESMVHSAYMTRFEGLEGDLIARDAELVSDLEEAFNARLPLLMQRGADAEAVRAEVRAMKDSLERAGELLHEAEGERSEVF